MKRPIGGLPSPLGRSLLDTVKHLGELFVPLGFTRNDVFLPIGRCHDGASLPARSAESSTASACAERERERSRDEAEGPMAVPEDDADVENRDGRENDSGQHHAASGYGTALV